MPKFLEALESRTFYSAAPVTLQAESAARSGALIARGNTGFTGTGYVDYIRSSGEWLEWTVNAASAGTHGLSFRYANASGDRPLELRVNGQAVRSRLSFPTTGSWATWKTVTLNVALAKGANKVRLTSIGSSGPNVDAVTVRPPTVTPTPTPTPPPPANGPYEAESAARFGPGVGKSNPGFTGTGYADYGKASGDWTEWTVNSASTGARTLTFRYANGSPDRPLELRVNGQVASSRLSFAPTGSWTTWKTVSISVSLAAGANKVRLTSIGSNGPNIDSLAVSGAVAQPTVAERLNQAADFAAAQLRRTAAEVPTDRYVNYTLPDGTWHMLPDPAWEAGFLPGSMWQMYLRTGDAYWRDQATARTLPLEVEKTRRYDTTFVLFKSFKPLYDQTHDAKYRDILLDAARAKASWYHEKIGAFRGWVRQSNSGDPRAQVGFYVDLMADLELFLWAAKETGNTQWMDMAVTHAMTTARYLVRPDGSTYQWGYFEDATGAFVRGEQYQGYADESTWSRGQAWAIYGFGVAYRETGNSLFLDMAKKTADYFISHLPADKVPYWDFNDPKAPNTYRDSSAAAIAASGLLELARLRSGTVDHDRYRAAAESILSSLAGPSYLTQGTSSRGILRHGALNVPTGVGKDTSLIFGDYFFLEALNRYFGR